MPEDLLYAISSKILGGKPPEDFVPMILPKELPSLEEISTEVNRDGSVEDVYRAFIPIDVPKITGDIVEDINRFIWSLTPENVIGKGGKIDLPEPIKPDDIWYIPPKGFTPQGMSLPKPDEFLPRLPKPPGMN